MRKTLTLNGPVLGEQDITEIFGIFLPTSRKGKGRFVRSTFAGFSFCRTPA